MPKGHCTLPPKPSPTLLAGSYLWANTKAARCRALKFWCYSQGKYEEKKWKVLAEPSLRKYAHVQACDRGTQVRLVCQNTQILDSLNFQDFLLLEYTFKNQILLFFWKSFFMKNGKLKKKIESTPHAIIFSAGENVIQCFSFLWTPKHLKVLFFSILVFCLF